MIYGNYKWQVDSNYEPAEDYGNYHPIILKLLKKRGIVSPEQIHKFFYPKLDYLYNPMLLKDMDKAVVRIMEALYKRERILVYGDYDVDGITSCAILVKLLRKLGGSVDYYIPSRLNEGYGLNKEAIDILSKQKIDLIITVDNGISSYEEVKYASKLGIDTIITDHHEPQQQIPEAIAVINPKQKECNYPFKELAGVGVALKLAQAIIGTNYPKLNQEFLELAAIGTLADMVLLLDENRIIVKNGLETLVNTSNMGLSAIMALLHLNENPIDAEKISYLLAPRINAAGRIADPQIAVELLLSENENRSLELATQLEKINQERQALEAKVLDEAKEMIQSQVDLNANSIIVISSPHWHPGVIGTVASKLVEIYDRPCIVIAKQGNEGRGSGRSIPGFNLFKAVNGLSYLLTKFGGHEQAVGLNIKLENIDIFRDKLNEKYRFVFRNTDFRPKLEIDLELNQRDITLELAQQIELMKPFGYGNPKPVFMCRNLHIQNSRTVGNGDKHLKLNLKSFEETDIDAIGFNFGLYNEELRSASIMDVAFCLEVNRWKGFVGPQLNIKDLRVPFLQDKLLDEIEKNYYKDFFSNLSQRDGSVLEDEKIKKGNIIVQTNIGIFEKVNYIKELFKTQRRVIVGVNTPYRAWQLITQLKSDDNFTKNIGVIYNLNSITNNNLTNIVAIDPFSIIKDESFDDIVFFDTPFSINLLKKKMINSPSNSNIHILFERGDLRYNFLVCKQILPSINQLKAVYNLLGKFTAGRFIGTFEINKLIKLLHEQSGINIHLVGLINVFKIFHELNVIDYYLKDELVHLTSYYKHNSNLRLESSRTYMLLYLLKKDVLDFYNGFSIVESKFIKNMEESKWI